MEEVFAVHHQSRVINFTEAETPKFIAVIDLALRLGVEITIELAAPTASVMNEIRGVFKKHRIRIHVITDQADPDALDYVANILAGATIGGIIGGVISWLVIASKAQILGPQVGLPFSLLCAVEGIFSGLAATRHGYRILARVREQRLTLDASPL